MGKNNNYRKVVLCLFVGALPFSQSVHGDQGSKLDQFEEEATRQRPANEPPHKTPPHEDDDHSKHHHEYQEVHPQAMAADPDPANGAIDIISLIIFAGGKYSWERVVLPVAVADNDPHQPSGPSATKPRLLGEGLIPYARLDGSYNRISSHIEATDWRGEIGYGPFGFEFRDMRYTESNPDDELKLTEYHALYRMSPSDYAEIDLGYGQLDIMGNAHNTGGSWTLPILIHPTPHFEIEYRPSWANVNGNDIRNHELAIGGGGRFWAVRAGYHWLETQNTRLSGPFIGLSLRL